jgi:hypothetical protein
MEAEAELVNPSRSADLESKLENLTMNDEIETEPRVWEFVVEP